jgi:hypothetical protein
LETLADRQPPAWRLALKSSSWRVTRWLIGAVAALTAVSLVAVPASANPHFMGELKSSPPLSPPFITSPAFYDISSHPQTVEFTTKVENLTDHVVTVTVVAGVHHILTYYGQNVADGQPGQPGITFKGSDANNHAFTEENYGTPFKMTITVQPKGASPQMVTFKTVMTTCGYFQFDIGKHDHGIHQNLAAGYARVLGCNTSSGGGTGGNGGAGGATGGVSAASAGLPLANTGEPIASGLLGLFMLVLGGLGLRFRRQ